MQAVTPGWGVRRRELVLALLRVAVLFALAYFALWGCGATLTAPHYAFGPNMGMQPPIAPLDGQIRAGGAVAVLQTETNGWVDSKVNSSWGAHAFFMKRVKESRFEIGANFYAGSTSLFAGGFGLRLRLLDAPLFVGIDASAGFFYASVGLPVSYRFGDVLVYTAPTSMLVGGQVGVRAPLGVALVFDKLIVGVEGGYMRVFENGPPGTGGFCTTLPGQAYQENCSAGYFYLGLSGTFRTALKSPPPPPPPEPLPEPSPEALPDAPPPEPLLPQSPDALPPDAPL